ncbi:hypothetical protein DGM98_19730 [Xanthomonas citri]|nr:hypothetical protein DGM98_19730 [Xanthomonas citri]
MAFHVMCGVGFRGWVIAWARLFGSIRFCSVRTCPRRCWACPTRHAARAGQALPSTARVDPKRLRADIRFIYDSYIDSNRTRHGHRQYRRRPARSTAPCVHGE